jgi:hypothetical protein
MSDPYIPCIQWLTFGAPSDVPTGCGTQIAPEVYRTIEGEVMRQDKYVFSIVDFLVGVAVLMILAALFVPHFVDRASKAKAAEPAHHAATVPASR